MFAAVSAYILLGRKQRRREGDPPQPNSGYLNEEGACFLAALWSPQQRTFTDAWPLTLFSGGRMRRPTRLGSWDSVESSS